MRPPRAFIALAVAGLAVLGAACGSDDKDDEAATSTTVAQVTTSSAAATTTTAAPAETTTSTAVATTTKGSVTMAGETVPIARLLAVAAGLCEAAAQAPTDFDEAERTFNGRSHDGLHLIARGLEQIDRAASAALLEAKQKVEGDFSRSATPATLVDDLKKLHEVTVASLARFKVAAGACPTT